MNSRWCLRWSASWFPWERDSLVVWSVVNGSSDAVRYQIYGRESAIMDLLPDVVFDFHVMDRCHRPVSELISEATTAFQRQ